MMKPKTPVVTQYTLTGSASQFDCIKNACETQARLEMGQFDAITDALMLRLHDQDWQLVSEKVRELERIISNMPRKTQQRSEYQELSWDIYQVVRHRLSWDRAIAEGLIKEGQPRDWKTMMTVNYDEPLHRSEEPLMRIERAKEPAIKKLDWNIFLDGQLWEAKALGGTYQVQESITEGKEGNYLVSFYFKSVGVGISDDLGVDERQGMQLAQEHFERTIRECLEGA